MNVRYLPIQPVQPWYKDALCAEVDLDLFFPEKGGSTREAKRICAGCEVRDDCLEYALDHDERFGIWGGLAERERRRLRPGNLGRRADTVTDAVAGVRTAAA